MADSSEKVSFRLDMQCSSLRAEAFLVFYKGSQPTLGQQITDMQPTVDRLLAEDFRKSDKGQSADNWPTIGRLSADSFLGELFFIFSLILANIYLCQSFCTYTNLFNIHLVTL